MGSKFVLFFRKLFFDFKQPDQFSFRSHGVNEQLLISRVPVRILHPPDAELRESAMEAERYTFSDK